MPFPSKYHAKLKEIEELEYEVKNLGDNRVESQIVGIIASSLSCSRKDDVVTLEEIKWCLKQLFQISDKILEDAEKEAKRMITTEASVSIKIVEAKDISPKQDTCDSFVKVSLYEKQTLHETAVQEDTRYPVWNKELTLERMVLQNNSLIFEVLKKCRKNKSKLKTAKLFRTRTEVLKDDVNVKLIGSCQLRTEDIDTDGLDSWFPLKNVSKSKERYCGSLHLVAKNFFKHRSEVETKKKYIDLVARILQQQFVSSFEDAGNPDGWIWNGNIGIIPTATLQLQAAFLLLPRHLQALCWWSVAVHVPNVDVQWLHLHLKNVLEGLQEGLYTADDVKELEKSLQLFIKVSLHKASDVFRFFPVPHVPDMERQLHATFCSLRLLESATQKLGLLKKYHLDDLSSYIKSALTESIQKWWKGLIDILALQSVLETKKQVKCIVILAREIYDILHLYIAFYEPVLIKGMAIHFFENIFCLLNEKYSFCCQTLLSKLYKCLPSPAETENGRLEFEMSIGSDFFQMYINTKRISQLGEKHLMNTLDKSELYKSCECFFDGIKHWIDVELCRADVQIKVAVKNDLLVPVDGESTFSISAVEVICIFQCIRQWWTELAWPFAEDSLVLLTTLLSGLHLASIKYADLVMGKITSRNSSGTSNDKFPTHSQISCALSNIAYILENWKKMPDSFGVHHLLLQYRQEEDYSSEKEKEFLETVSHIVSEVEKDLNLKKDEFSDGIPTKVDSHSKFLKTSVN